MRCLIYGRVSLEEQTQQYGLAAQLRACREYAAKHGYKVTAEITDEGISGTILDRPGLERVRSLVRDGSVDVVLALDADRLSRELAHLLILKPEIEKRARLEFVTAKFEDSPSGRMFFGIRGVIAQYERELVRERTMRGRREKARSGFLVGGRVPYGYDYVGKSQGERGRYVVNEEQAATVRQMFAWADEGVSIRGIVRRLNEAGIEPSRAGKWGKSSVARILSAELYTGIAHYNRRKRTSSTLKFRPESEWIALGVPPIIDRSLWDRVAARLADNKRLSGRPTRRYLLRGLVRCACGKRMVGEPGHGRPAYRCSVRCGASQVSAAKLDRIVWRAVVAPFSDPKRLRALVEQHFAAVASDEGQAKAAGVRTQLEKVKAREFRAVRALLDMPDYDLVKQQLAEIRRQRRALEVELARCAPAPVALSVDGIAAEMRYALSHLPEDKRQEALRYCIETITFRGSDVEIRCFFVAQFRTERADDRANIEQTVVSRRIPFTINAKVEAA